MSENHEVIASSHLKEGAEECLQNAERLLRDAKILFYEKGSNNTCFALIVLSMEEMAKASKLNDWAQIDEDMSKREWEKFKYKESHVNKLFWMEQKDVVWLSEIAESYEDTQKNCVTSRMG